MAGSADGGPERLGRALGRAVARGQIAAERAVDQETRERVSKAGHRVAEQARPAVKAAVTMARQEMVARGPDVAEQAAQRAVDRVLWGLGGRWALLGAVIRPLAGPARKSAGTLARDLANAAGGHEDPPPPEEP